MTLSPLTKAVTVFGSVLAATTGLYFSGINVSDNSRGLLPWIRHVWTRTVIDVEPATFPISEDPLVIYIQNFVTAEEAAHLVRLAEDGFSPSPMWDNAGKPHIDKAYRLSTTAKLNRNDDVIARVEARARALPFYRAVGDFLPMVVQNYGVAGVYRDHYDWFDNPHAVGGNIASTFFVYVHANCTGGGTNFARLTMPPEEKEGDGERWCEFVDCDRPLDEGVTFKPMVGNAVYWENLDVNGAGHPRTLHAGMPVTSGSKMGLNMWTWKPV